MAYYSHQGEHKRKQKNVIWQLQLEIVKYYGYIAKEIYISQ